MRVEDNLANKLVEAEIVEVAEVELKAILKHGNFIFDWALELEYEIYVLKLKSTDNILGMVSLENVLQELRIEIRLLELTKNNVGRDKNYARVAGCLIAFACREAFKRGFDGFVSLIPKTNLIAHYVNTYGFIQVGRHLAIDMKGSSNLIDRYLNDNH